MSFFGELRRRNVHRVSAAYIVTAWLVIQVVETILPAFGFGDAAVRYVTLAFAVGLVPAIVLSWVFEWTPEGFRRDAQVDHGDAASVTAAKRLDRLILVVMALALGYFGFDKFVLGPQRESAAREQQAQALAQATEEARREGRSEALIESYGDVSIAVLPFEDMSQDGDQEYLADGIAEELLNALARVPELRVTSRTSSFAFKGQALEVPEIGRRLKVGHVLEGSVRKAGDQIRVTAQLIEARSDTHLWSQTWDRKLENVFAIQDEIAQAVMASLQGQLLGAAPRTAPARAMEEDLRAYDLVLRGRHLLNQRNPAVFDRAQRYFEEAVAVDPGHAPAWGGLSKALMAQLSWGRQKPEQVMPEIRQAVQRALDLDPGEHDALSTRGRVLWRSGDIEAARAHFRMAVASNSSDSDAYRWLGVSYLSLDPSRYLEYIRQAYLVDPTNTLSNNQMIQALRLFGRFEEAMAVARDFHRLYPDGVAPLQAAAETRRHQGRFASALAYYNHLYRIHPDAPWPYNQRLFFLVDNLNALDMAETWREELERRLRDGRPEQLFGLPSVVALYGVTGRTGQALEFLASAQAVSALPGWAVALLTLRIGRDHERARGLFEDSLGPDRSSRFDPGFEAWPVYADYILTLLHDGERERAAAMANAMRDHIDAQLDAGVVFTSGMEPLRVVLAQVEAALGNTAEAMTQLQRAEASDVDICLVCLQVFPHFDSLRGQARFEALLADLETQKAAEAERLEAQGALLSPAELAAIEHWSFEPFADLD